MKTLTKIAIVAMTLAMSAPAMAHEPREVRYGQVDNRYNQRHYDQRHHRGNNKLAICITERGIVLGTKRDCYQSRYYDDSYDYRYESQRQREIDDYNYRWTHRNNNPRECYQVRSRDAYGNYVTRVECTR